MLACREALHHRGRDLQPGHVAAHLPGNQVMGKVAGQQLRGDDQRRDLAATADRLGHEPNALDEEQAAAAALLARGELADLRDPRITGAGDQYTCGLLRHCWSLTVAPTPALPRCDRGGEHAVSRRRRGP